VSADNVFFFFFFFFFFFSSLFSFFFFFSGPGALGLKCFFCNRTAFRSALTLGPGCQIMGIYNFVYFNFPLPPFLPQPDGHLFFTSFFPGHQGGVFFFCTPTLAKITVSFLHFCYPFFPGRFPPPVLPRWAVLGSSFLFFATLMAVHFF